ncbi:glycosyltransferase family 2 protein [Paramuribaculum intestinale]|uniref:glycosyltransferase family 2 protein n=1 Tax=Paramuribaculum intestinale TaxID=2094151 RepID=UPI0025B41599|nr:glycosyltransferase family 2 protein [Paramuribaculum intestinale]
MKKVSIITPAYNAAKYISRTIDSVRNQTYTEWEMIIIDDGSRDNTAEIVANYANKDNRIKLLRQNNAGSAAARNNALRNSTGQLVCFLDADDLWDADFLSSQVTFIKERDAALVFASYRRINAEDDEILKPFIVPDRVNYIGLLKTCSISCLTAMYDKERVGENYFNENLRSMRDDFVFWLQILKKIPYAYGNKAILASYRVFANSTTGNKKKVIKPQFNVYYKVEKLGLIKSIYYLLNWAINGLKKYHS